MRTLNETATRPASGRQASAAWLRSMAAPIFRQGPRRAGVPGAAMGRLMRRPGRWIGARLSDSEPKSLLPEIGAVLCLLGLLWTSVTLALEHEYAATALAAKQSSGNLARAFEESTRRTVGEIDQILLSARAFYTAQGAGFRFDRWAATQILPDRMTAAIGMADRGGHVFADTLPIPPNVSIADRRHFRAQLDPAHDRLFISRPVHGRVSNQNTIQFTRKLLDRAGGFAGVAVLSLDCEELSRFYQTVDLGGGFVSLLSADGVMLARGPLLAGAIGGRLPAGPTQDALLNRRGGVLRFYGRHGRLAQIASFRRLDDYPLIVMVSLDAPTVFQRYWSLRRRLVAAGVVATLGIGLIGLFWLRQKRRTVASRQALTITLETISQGILMLDGNGRVPVVNPRALHLLGLPTEISSAARRCAASRALALAGSDAAAASSSTVGTGDDSCFETIRDDGAIIEVRRHALADGGSVHTYTDVTGQRLADARVRYLAHHDALTGLANRAQLRNRVPEVLDRPDHAGALTAFMMIDLDGFKGVNDALGHDAGDQLLILVAQRLQALAHETDFVARLGGDEFVVLQPGLQQAEDAIRFAGRLLEVLAQPADVAGQQVRIGASIGIAFHPRDGQDGDALLKHADIALYSAKAGGRGVFRCFDGEMIRAVNERHMLESDLRRALENQELTVHFQPQFSCGCLQITGFEALARWRHPLRGEISPEIFIHVAEQCGLINRLGHSVLEQACAAAASWRKRHRIAVNVSLLQLREPGLCSDIAAILARTGLPANLLELEVTESVMADDNSCVLESLHALKAMGVCITLDDFGTGYSSLSYLRRFPFDKIKIDRSFVQGQASDQGVRVILGAILAMCHNLGLAVVGEGVETRQQLLMLQHRGCTDVQGYLLGRPMQPELVEEFVRGKTPRQLGPTGTPDATASELLLAS